MIIPNIEEKVGLSFGSINQLRITPDTGVRNFQIFKSETLMFGSFRRVYHMENPAAGISDNHIQTK